MNDDLSFSLDISGTDRRQTVRKPLRTAAVLEVSGTKMAVRIVDISRGGIGVSVDRSIPLNAPCTVSFSLPCRGKAHTMSLHGRVIDVVLARAHGFRVGLALDPPNWEQ